MADSELSPITQVFALQGITVFVSLLIGTAVMVFAHGHVLGVLPANEWSPVIAWILSAVIGYASAGITSFFLFIIVIGNFMSD